MSRTKIILTKDIVAYKKWENKAEKISKWTIMYADELRTIDFWSFADVTKKDVTEKKTDENKEEKSKKKTDEKAK